MTRKAESEPEPPLTKEEAGYIHLPDDKLWPPPGFGIRCGTCVHATLDMEEGSTRSKKRKWLNVAGTCDLVQGEIESQACCNLWETEDGEYDWEFLSGEEVNDVLEGDDAD